MQISRIARDLPGIKAHAVRPAYRGGMDIATVAKWIASVSGMIAAMLVAADLGKRDTGWAMVLFCGSAIAWLTGAALTRDWALGTQNVVLFLIDLFGVYRYLIRDSDG